MTKRLRLLTGALVGLILLGWGLGVLVLHVAHDFFHWDVDRPVNRLARGHHSRAVGQALIQVAHLGSEPVVVTVALLAGAFWARRRRNAAPFAALALACTGGSVIALAVKVAVRRGQSGLPGGLSGLTELGFPSGHATLAAAVYGTMAFLFARWARDEAVEDGVGRRRRRWVVPAGLVLLAAVIGVARVYNGQHDTTDVVAGWMLGGLWAWAVARFATGSDSPPAMPPTAAGGRHSRPAPDPGRTVPPGSDGPGAGRRRPGGRRRRPRRRLDPTAATAATAAAGPDEQQSAGLRVANGRR